MEWRQNLKSLRQPLVGNGNSPLREVLKECACLCIRRQPIVLPRARHCDVRAWSPPRADDPDRPRLLHDDLFALSISASHPVAARLVIGPDNVRDVGAGNERYDAVAPSLNGIGTEVDGRHCNPPRASVPGLLASPYVAKTALHLNEFRDTLACARVRRAAASSMGVTSGEPRSRCLGKCSPTSCR